MNIKIRRYKKDYASFIAIKRDLFNEVCYLAGIDIKVSPLSRQKGQTIYLHSRYDQKQFLDVFTETIGDPTALIEDSPIKTMYGQIDTYDYFKKEN